MVVRNKVQRPGSKLNNIQGPIPRYHFPSKFMQLTVQVAGKSDVGRVRKNNEDNFGYDSRYGIYVVCDGMGGQAAGEVAAKIGVDTILDYFRYGATSSLSDDTDDFSPRASRLRKAIQAANQAVHDEAAKHEGRSGMGSTVVATHVDGTFFSIGHVGDSRIYLVRGGDIQQLTSDHSLVMEQVRRGIITLAEARTSKMQNIITRALGADENIDPDLDDLLAQPDDVLVLCSDGLTRHLPDEIIGGIVAHTPDLQRACDALIKTANDSGGEDNITCLLVRFVTQPWYKKFFGRFSPGARSSQWQNSL